MICFFDKFPFPSAKHGSEQHSYFLEPWLNPSMNTKVDFNNVTIEIHDDGSKELDAGLRPLDHYKQRLGYKFPLRQSILPLVRWETPYLAELQSLLRSPALDIFFVNTANLGTHTFFLIGLPVLHWLGQPAIVCSFVDLLAPGVFFTGMIKDFLCLPRPLSPPLQRINMSGLTALEYGFPSTHSANAVSVALYCLTLLDTANHGLSAGNKIALQCIAWVYALSVVMGRIYCGMHGFLDCLAGILIGILLWWVKITYGVFLDSFVCNGSLWAPLTVMAFTILLIRVHPEPADACCKCFEDGVAFAGVFIGVKFGMWRNPVLNTHGESTSRTGPIAISILKLLINIVVGVSILFAWRAVTKPLLHRVLPPFYRLLEKARLDMPRRYFMRASSYRIVPPIPDQPLPSFRDIPELLARFSRPRSVSVGPQSEIDVWEQIDYRDERRRRRSNSVESNMSTREARQHLNSIGEKSFTDDDILFDDERDEKLLRTNVEEPRQRYDVEVVTKLIVYTGIGWLSVDLLPTAFQAFGLSLAGVTG